MPSTRPKRQRSPFYIALIGFVALLWSVPATAEEAKVEPEAAKVLKAMSETLAKAESFSFRATTLYDDVQPGGIGHTVGREVQIFVRRPNGLYVRARGDDGLRTYFWYNGQEFSRLFDAKSGLQYSQIKAPDTLDKMFDYLADNYAMNLPLADFLYSDIYGTFAESLISGAYLGKRMVDGVPCHHVSFESEGADFQLWVAAEGPALPRRYVITYVNQPSEPQFIAQLADWDLSSYLDPGMFDFTPQKGAKEVPAVKLDN